MRILLHPKCAGRRAACVPLALSKVLNLEFNTVNQWLLRNGYRENDTSGTYTYSFTDIPLFSICIEDKLYIFKHRPEFKGLTINRFNYKAISGRFIIEIREHWLCQVGYIVYDTQMRFKSIINNVWELVEN